MEQLSVSDVGVGVEGIGVGADIIVPEPPIDSLTESPESIIRAKILATLKVYPVLSPSMLQAALGASLSPRIWKPTLEALTQEGIITQWDTPADEDPSVRQRPYPCLALTSFFTASV